MPTKKIVLCLDGTWNTPAQEMERENGTKVFRPTNVLKIARAILPEDSTGMPQVAYYDTGIGAMSQYPGTTNGILRWFDSKLGGAWGAGFEGNVDAAYRFLAHNYEHGDEVYIFGYSRGAAQAQALCRYIDWMGGIPAKSDIYYLPRFFLRYLEDHGKTASFDKVKNEIEHRGNKQQPLEPFRKVPVKFLGLWDTVLALGSRAAAGKKTSSKDRAFLVSENLPECVERARHAMGIDERRKDFRPEVWLNGNAQNDMQQVWFPGGHGNVGGGRSSDGLANATLKWILGELRGLEMDQNYLAYFGDNATDTLNNLRSPMYKARDFKSFFDDEQGSRVMTGFPASSNFEVHSSVFTRLASDSAKVETKKDKTEVVRYCPTNLLEYFAEAPQYDAMLDSDVLAKVQKIRL